MIPPKTFDYILVKKLGSGSWGTVYLATPKKGGENVALKIYGSQVAMYSNYIEKEFVVGKKLSACDGVVKYIDLFETTLPSVPLIESKQRGKKTYVTVLEYLKGYSMGQYLNCGQQTGYVMPPDQFVKTMKRLCGIVQCIHDLGYAHADIKPDNIMYNETRLTLVDLGLACRFFGRAEDNCTSETLTTRMFTHPELVKLEKFKGGDLQHEYDVLRVYIPDIYRANDIWSLGMTALSFLEPRLYYLVPLPYVTASKSMERFVNNLTDKGQLPTLVEPIMKHYREIYPGQHHHIEGFLKTAFDRDTSPSATLLAAILS